MYPITNATRLLSLSQVGLMAVLPPEHTILKRCPNLALVSDTPKGKSLPLDPIHNTHPVILSTD